MESTHIKQLLERYYSGNTTLEEERQLREFFASPNIPPELEAEQAMFRYFNEARQETTGQTIELKQPQGGGAIIPIRKLMRAVAAAAAVVVLAVATWLIAIDQQPQQRAETVEITNPEQAYLETKRALLMVSMQLNKGTRDLKKLAKLNETKRLISATNTAKK